MLHIKINATIKIFQYNSSFLLFIFYLNKTYYRCQIKQHFILNIFYYYMSIQIVVKIFVNDFQLGLNVFYSVPYKNYNVTEAIKKFYTFSVL